MFYIIESEKQINFLKNYKEVFLHPIKFHDRVHSQISPLTAIYLRPLLCEKGYILPIHHPEGLNLSEDLLSALLSSFEHIYVWDKKEWGRYGAFKGVKDLRLKHTLSETEKIDLSTDNPSYHYFYRKFGHLSNINQIIPISKLHEYCEEFYEKVKPLIQKEEPPGYSFFNNTAIPVFYLLEQSGVGIVEQMFKKQFSVEAPGYSIQDGKIYTEYNLGNYTTRPTNTFNKVNFAAIPKEQAFRSCFSPQNDQFVEMDYSGYHLRLIGQEIGYSFGEDSPHEHLSRLLLGKQEISSEEHDRIKQSNFQAIYGYISPELSQLEFYQKLKQFRKELHKKHKEQGYIEVPISGKRFGKEVEDFLPEKLTNYYIQALETSLNIQTLKQVLQYLEGRRTKIVLYTYDAVVLDYNKKDGEEVLEGIKKIMERGGSVPVSVKKSSDLNFK